LVELFELLAAFQPPMPMPSPGAVACTPTICGTLQQQILAPLTGCLLWSCWVPFTSLFCLLSCCVPCPGLCFTIYTVPLFCTNIPCTVACIIGIVSMPIKLCCGVGSGIETMIYQNMLPSEMSTWLGRLAPCLGVCGGGGGPTILLPM
jgi:hypothetical protein